VLLIFTFLFSFAIILLIPLEIKLSNYIMLLAFLVRLCFFLILGLILRYWFNLNFPNCKNIRIIFQLIFMLFIGIFLSRYEYLLFFVQYTVVPSTPLLFEFWGVSFYQLEWWYVPLKRWLILEIDFKDFDITPTEELIEYWLSNAATPTQLKEFLNAYELSIIKEEGIVINKYTNFLKICIFSTVDAVVFVTEFLFYLVSIVR
jgi:hypothetical protein